MFVKFDINGKIEAWALQESVEDIRPSGDGFEPLPIEVAKEDLHYLIKRDGTIQVDENRKAADKQKSNDLQSIARLKAELEKIKEDIEQVLMFHMQRDDLLEKQARAAAIVNELRVLEGKGPREIKEEIL